ncbi:hypothetical protein ACFPAF_13700 [Hymenobacter endophyticus]
MRFPTAADQVRKYADVSVNRLYNGCPWSAAALNMPRSKAASFRWP